MMTPRERYDIDPVFRYLVSSFFNLYSSAGDGITPSEIREAAGYAWQMYYERHAGTFIVDPKDIR